MYLLQKISQKFPDIFIIQVCDNDGPFLLIECADILPSWIEQLSPEDMENRVFFWQGQLHIIPKVIKAASKLSLEEALEAIQNPTLLTLANPQLQTRVMEQIEKFPDCLLPIEQQEIKEKELSYSHYHHMALYVPHRVAYLLHNEPTLLSFMVDAFIEGSNHSRGGSGTGGLPKFTEAISIENHQKKFIKTRVCLTRLQYVALATVKPLYDYLPKEYFTSAGKSGEKENQDLNAYDFGMKLVLGFHLFLQNIKDYSTEEQPLPDCKKEIIEKLQQKYSITAENSPSTIIGRKFPLDLTKLSQLMDQPITDVPLTTLQADDPLDWLAEKGEEPFIDVEERTKKGKNNKQRTNGAKNSRLNPEPTSKDKMFDAKNLQEMSEMFEQLMAKESDYRGISFQDDDEASSDSHSSDYFDSSDAEINEDLENTDLEDADLEDADLADFEEIFETLLHDPDLFMKLIEKCYQQGTDPKDLIDALKEFKELDPTTASEKARVEGQNWTEGDFDEEAQEDRDDSSSEGEDLLWGKEDCAANYHTALASSSSDDE